MTKAELIEKLLATCDRMEKIRSRTVADMNADDAWEFRAAQVDLENVAVKIAHTWRDEK